MLKHGNVKFTDEAEIRSLVEKFTVNQLNGTESIYGSIAGVINAYGRNTVLYGVKNYTEARKATLVDAYVKHIVGNCKEWKQPTTFEELSEAVIRETMAYDGCYSGKADWLESVGLQAPPAPLRIEMVLKGAANVDESSSSVEEYLNKLLPEGVTIVVDSVYADEDDY